MHLSIRWKLILSISIPLLITYLGMLTWDYARQRQEAMGQLQHQVSERAQNLAAHLDSRLHAVMQVAESAANTVENHPQTAEPQLRSLLSSNLRQDPWVVASAVVEETQTRPDHQPLELFARRGVGGPRVITFGELANRNAQRSAWYRQCKDEKKPVWTNPYTEPFTGSRMICTYATPILVNDEFHGVATASVLVENLQELRPRAPRGTTRPAEPATTQPATDLEGRPRRTNALGHDGYVIIDHDGRIISHANLDLVNSQSIITQAQARGMNELADAARAALAGGSGVVRVSGLEQLIPGYEPDQHHWIAFAAIPSTGWVFVTATPESAMMDPIVNRLLSRAGFLAGGLVILIIIVLLVSIRISRPIERLAGAVDRLAAGDLDVQVAGVKTSDELGRLAQGFNHMVHQLKSHVAELTAQTAAREKVESELRIARQIQNDLLPRTFPPFPDRTEFELHAVNVPASEVAGDFYDFFFSPNGLLTIVIADVSGKGVPAALLMAVTRTIVRNLASAGLGVLQIAERANAMLVADTSDSMFVTMFLCQYDPATGRLTYVNAGHPPPYRFGCGTAPRPFGEFTSPLLGVSASGSLGPFEQREEQLAIGQTLLLYTDGVTEARSLNGTMLGEQDLVALLIQNDKLSPDALCVAIVAAVDAYQSGRRHDDITLVALRRSR